MKWLASGRSLSSTSRAEIEQAGSSRTVIGPAGPVGDNVRPGEEPAVAGHRENLARDGRVEADDLDLGALGGDTRVGPGSDPSDRQPDGRLALGVDESDQPRRALGDGDVDRHRPGIGRRVDHAIGVVLGQGDRPAEAGEHGRVVAGRGGAPSSRTRGR